MLAGAVPEKGKKIERKKKFQDRTRKLNKIQVGPGIKKKIHATIPENLGIGRFQLETGLWG